MNKLQELAEAANISSSYIDKTGQEHQTTDGIRRFFLKAMGFNIQTDEDAAQALSQLECPCILPPVLSFYDNENISFTINADGEFHAILTDEQNCPVWEKSLSGKTATDITDIPVGYYTLTVTENDSILAESLIIYAPEMCYQPECIQKREHLFGVSLMLYALRSANSQGIGDFSDLERIIRLTKANGGDVIGLNPLGVMTPETLPSSFAEILKGDVSPYRTLSRMFINYAYIDLTREPDYIASEEVKQFMSTPGVAAELKRLNENDKIPYRQVLLFKRRLLRMMYDKFKKSANQERRLEFERFKTEKGVPLANLCLFETLLEFHKGEHFWRYWNDGAADINSPFVEEFRQDHAEDTDFYAYAHFLAEKQLKHAQALARSLGMKIGLYGDMPIGAASNGVEVWENPSAYVLDAGIGAPADPMRPKGQSWGFTPYHPFEIKKQRYAQFISLARANMQNFGALRIDHAMGLKRLFWGFFAENNPVLQGAYIYYDIKDLTAILSLESNRARCLLIGEDLGTVPEGFREYMAAHGLLSYKVFFRQKEKDGTFISPEKYIYMSLAQSSTHDQATSLGFWTNEDIEVFKSCGLYVNQEQYAANLDGRRKDRENLISALDKENLLKPELKAAMAESTERGNFAPQGLEEAVNCFGAKTESALYLVRLCDIFKQKALDNAPGTIDEYTNWRLKLCADVEAIESTPSFANALQKIAAFRPQ